MTDAGDDRRSVVLSPIADRAVALALRHAARQVPRDVLFEAWPAEPRTLERLIPVRQRAPAG